MSSPSPAHNGSTALARRTWFSSLPVRTRVMGLLLLLTTLTLVVSGATAYTLQRSDVVARVDDDLTRSFQEFRILAQDGVDHATGRSFTEADQMVFVAMQRTMPAPNEGMLGFSEGLISWTANEAVELRLEEDPELVQWAGEQTGRQDARIETVNTSRTSYRAVLVPVQLAEDPTPGILLLAYDLNAELTLLNNTFLTYTLVGSAAVLLVGLIGWYLVGQLLRPLRDLQATAAEISATDLDRRVPVTGHDDVAQLAEGFNAMLDRVETAMVSQRQLLDDVGHELRTPITIVQGNLETQDVQDPQDVAQSRDTALDELARMQLMVDDLVTLAQARRQDFLKRIPVDVQSLTEEVLNKAARLGRRAWALDSAAQLVAGLDARRVTQAWLQLASNAVKYSAEGSTVGIGSALTQDRRIPGEALRLWVRDEGIGVRAEEQSRIFERFGRGSNTTRAEGSGLGLTIVTAIARAHHGFVDLQSTPEVGSTFSLILPLQAVLPPAPAHPPKESS